MKFIPHASVTIQDDGSIAITPVTNPSQPFPGTARFQARAEVLDIVDVLVEQVNTPERDQDIGLIATKFDELRAKIRAYL